jgi:hypothetical protein
MKTLFFSALASAMFLATPAFGQNEPLQVDSVGALVNSMPGAPYNWGSNNLQRIAKDSLNQGRPLIEIDRSLLERQARARDLSIADARERMMQRFAAREQEQRLSGNRGAESGSSGN